MPDWAKLITLAIVAVLIGAVLFESQVRGGSSGDDQRGLPQANQDLSVSAPSAAVAFDPDDTAEDGSADDTSAAVEPTATPLDEAIGRIEADPLDAQAWHVLGTILLDQQDYFRAVEAFAAELEVSPDDPVARAELGKSLLFMGMLRAARAELRRALELDDSLAEAHLHLGVTYSHAAPADIPAAREAWERVVALEPPDSELAQQATAYLDAYPGRGEDGEDGEDADETASGAAARPTSADRQE